MTIHCNQLDDLLLDGSPLAMQTAARHAEICPTCAETLLAWDEISQTAQTMRHTWQDDMLWPRIARALREEQRPSRSSWLWQVAAAFILTIGLGATMFYAVRVQTHEAAFDRDILRISALDHVERAEQAHRAAIRQLEEIAGEKVDHAAASPLMVSYREKLMLLDDAIAECEDNIARNRQNAHLRRQLLTMYSEKQQTLEDVLREERDVITR
jgi:hypothetical protein